MFNVNDNLQEFTNKKIILDLNKSFNNYCWKDSKELKAYIEYMKETLWKLYKEDNLDDDTQNRLYDILDMFTSAEIE